MLPSRSGRISFLSALAISIFSVPDIASACKCPQNSVQEDIDWADAIYAGRVISTQLDRNLEEYVCTFEVFRVWKGPQNPVAKITTKVNMPACGLAFNTGMVYMVYSKNGVSGQCSGTRYLGQAEEAIKILGAPLWVNEKARALFWYDGHLGPSDREKFLREKEKAQ